MKVTPRKLAGAFEVRLEPRWDARGYFMRTWDERLAAEAGIARRWVQENQSRSVRRHILRGLHFQRPPHAEAKLVRCVVGRVLDVFVDLRRGSPSYGRWDAVELAAEEHNMVFIPRGCAHGFYTLTDESVVQYKVDACYAPQAEIGLRWDSAGIDWPAAEPLLSDKDRALPDFATVETLLAGVADWDAEADEGGR